MYALFALMFLFGIVVTIVGVVLMIIDYAKERKMKTSLIIFGAGLAFGIVGYAGTDAVDAHQEKVAQAQEKKDEQAFKAASDKFVTKYATIASNSEDLGNTIYDTWGDDIDNSGDDYDPDDTLTKVMINNADDIMTIDNEVRSEKKLLNIMEAHKNDKYNYSTYKKAYTDLKSLTDLVTSTSGSYYDFGNDFSDADDAVASQYENLTDN